VGKTFMDFENSHAITSEILIENFCMKIHGQLCN